MNIKIMARGMGYLLIAGGLLGAGIALSNRPYPTAGTSKTEPSATAALDVEFAQCQAIGPKAARRYLQSGPEGRSQAPCRIRQALPRSGGSVRPGDA